MTTAEFSHKMSELAQRLMRSFLSLFFMKATEEETFVYERQDRPLEYGRINQY